MTIKDYQKYVKQGASEKYQDIKFATLALVGEVGEVCDVIKKNGIYSASHLVNNLIFKENIKDELGDVLWQYTAILNTLGLTFEEVINCNIEKLNYRHGDKKLDTTGGKR